MVQITNALVAAVVATSVIAPVLAIPTGFDDSYDLEARSPQNRRPRPALVNRPTGNGRWGREYDDGLEFEARSPQAYKHYKKLAAKNKPSSVYTRDELEPEFEARSPQAYKHYKKLAAKNKPSSVYTRDELELEVEARSPQAYKHYKKLAAKNKPSSVYARDELELEVEARSPQRRNAGRYRKLEAKNQPKPYKGPSIAQMNLASRDELEFDLREDYDELD